MQDVSPAELARLIQDSGKFSGGPIRLIACSSGMEEDGAAQQLANILGVPVWAPLGIVFHDKYGNLAVPIGQQDARSVFRQMSGCWNPENWKVFLPKEE